MFELVSVTYEECRKEYFEKLKAEANRKMEYWSKRVDKEEPWDPRARANVYASEWGAAVSYLNDALKALEMIPKWISVEERLPPCGERVLITEGSAVFEAYLSISHKWVRNGIGWMECVTHWQPLPPAPKED